MDLIESIFKVEPGREADRLARRYGYRPFMVERYLMMLGSEAEDLLEANEEPMPETIRCNDYIINCNKLEERLRAKGFRLEPIPFTRHGYKVLEAPIPPGATHEYLQGYYYIQDPGSMTVVYHLDPRPGELILDAAAAPGGKATQILQETRDSAVLVAVEVSRRRIKALRSHLNRMRFSNYILIRGDSRRVPGIEADRILLDAPSSGEGIIRKDPSRKTSRSIKDLRVVHELQYSMLSSLVDRLKPGGTLVYAACTTAVEEGELVVSRLLWSRSDVYVEATGITPGDPGIEEYGRFRMHPEVRKCSRLWPHRHGTEGFFICRLRRSHT
ncbi:MAG: RsmB/NOP family class I SAM-dependent RNA methyltransferase [Desulfurococcales archaeon]|nr:RsmB/NOP family class I SAM-dependent RNA methyltransferase [Desulfurococcales archaeon]